MKKIIPFILAILLTTSSFAQNTEQLLSEKVKVVFPGKPEKQTTPNGATVYVNMKDSNTYYMGMSLDLAPLGLTEEMILSAGDGLWEQMTGPMMAQLPGAALTKDSVMSWKGKSCLYMEIDGSKSTAPLLKGKKAFIYAFFVGSLIHEVVYYSTSPTAKASDAKVFFESVAIKEQ
jgi:hypothetical protein